ncbi:hypothetical protein ARMGADRAFT_134352 [Armillaria gallica]|uniref:F-box domain-containing protein n=1 Tax=Armillaria gallica TaxID=47427 RepID=A0A2H3C8R5_ARMGA|nr:hypothetical protein ARMGADRAFT_134352 [Armillaria gallica]
MDSLPQELVDALVDILSNDRRSLCALLSTSRSLRSQGRVHFFRIVHLPKEGSVSIFLDLCAPEIPHLVEDLLVALPRTVERREGLERLLERYPLPNVRTVTLKHFRCFEIKDSVPSALLSYSLTSSTLNIEFILSLPWPMFWIVFIR